MTAKFPASIATNADLGQPLGGDPLDAPDHAGIHRQITDEIIAMQNALGRNLSGVAALIPPPPPSALSALTDVDGTVSPSDDDALVWDAASGKWIAKQIVGVQNIDELNDVVIDPATLAADDALLWDAGALKWVAGPLPTIDTSKFLLTDDIDVADGVAGLDGSGKIPAALLPPLAVGAMLYEGAKNVTAALGTYVPKQGSTIVPTVAGTVDASWPGAAGKTVTVSDVLVFDGTNWHIIAGAADLGTVVQKTSVLTDGGTLDLTVAMTVTPVAGMVVTATKAGAPDASWVGVANPVVTGKQYQWNGAAWGAVDLTKIAPAAVTDARYVVGAQPLSNLFVGTSAGSKNTTGDYNAFFGANAGLSNTTGSYNFIFGVNAGRENTVGSANNFLGGDTGRENTSGQQNNFFSGESGRFNTTGSYNNFFGQRSGYSNTTGISNNFLGYRAGYNNTTASGGIAVGQEALFSNTTGVNNKALGTMSGSANTTGNYNNYIGYLAGSKSTPVVGAQGITGATTWSGPWVVGNVYDFGDPSPTNGAVIDGTSYPYRHFTATKTTHVLGAQAGVSVSVSTMDAANNLSFTTAIGNLATAAFDNSTAIGTKALTDKANQVVLGDGTVVEVKTDGIYVGKIGGVSQRMVGLQELKTIVAAAGSYHDFQIAIAALT